MKELSEIHIKQVTGGCQENAVSIECRITLHTFFLLDHYNKIPDIDPVPYIFVKCSDSEVEAFLAEEN